MMRRVCAAASLALLLLATGCWNRVELNDLAIVTAAGMDLSDEGQVRLTLSLVVPGMVPTPGAGGRSPEMRSPVMSVTGTGQDVLDAATHIQLEVPRRLFWGQVRVIVLGEAYARHGVRDGLDFWSRNRQPRLTSLIIAVPGEARQFLSARPMLRRLPSEAIREVLTTRAGEETTLKDFLIALAGGDRDPFAPRFETKPTEGEQRLNLAMTGVALFRRDKLVGWLDENEARGLVWLREKDGAIDLSLQLGRLGRFGLEITRSRSRLTAMLDRGRVLATLKVKTEDDLTLSASNLDLSKRGALETIEDRLAAVVAEQVRHTFQVVTREYRVDPMGIGAALHRRYPAAWAKLRDNWPERLPEVELTVQVESHVRRTGKHGPPLTVPESELKHP